MNVNKIITKLDLLLKATSKKKLLTWRNFCSGSSLWGYSGVACFSSYMNFKLLQTDAKSAFLSGKILWFNTEGLYMVLKQPPGFEDKDFSNHIYCIWFNISSYTLVWKT